jgi:hypothetical protein
MQNYQVLYTDGYLKGSLADEFDIYIANTDAGVLERLKRWAKRETQKETRDEHAFIGTFFEELWGYVPNGKGDKASGFQVSPQHPIPRSGQSGGTGKADLALAYFGRKGVPDTLQVVCEFKDVRSGLDSPQNRKGNDRSPVQQCADYLKESRARLFGNESVQPKWAIVTDMNEFRLYYWGRMPAQCQRFIVSGKSDEITPLTGDSKSAQFQRFVFWRLFRADMLLTIGGPSRLEQMLGAQWKSERDLENDFYENYRAFRERLYVALRTYNPGFKGTRGELVRYSQRIVDRLIFVLYCEDMGKALDFPQNLLRDNLRELAGSSFYQADDTTAWDRIKQLFHAMATGTPFSGRAINYFNGGLFAPDPVMESLRLPTTVFCERGQDADPDCATDTLLYLSATYNFGLTGDGERTITLLTLGRIFEQSITELEIRAAEEDERVSINKLSKRKRDGVYYTPEWVTRYIVQETVGRRLEEIKREAGWKEADYPDADQIEKKTTGWHNYRKGVEAYRSRLETIRVIDPACGSGAFLIQALEFLLAERRRISELYAQLTKQADAFDSDENIRSILAQNIFGVDINPESVEITKLALWLHTAVPGAPLTTLDDSIRCGNSLIGPDVYNWCTDLLSALDADEKDRLNAFDWCAAFPAAFAAGGFDCVIGNPPYVKLQNFLKVEAHAADYLLNATRPDGTPVYRSTRTGNFDLYLPFIEKGLGLLNGKGRMGYIAPSVWLKNEYGEALRELISENRQLERWIDFASFMVFDEAIVYTALQFFTRHANDEIRFAYAPDGAVSSADWAGPVFTMPYAKLPVPTEAWNLLPEQDRMILGKLYAAGQTLEQAAKAIVVGVQTSADDIYHLTRIAPGRYKTKAGEEVLLEDAVMKPLVSGPEADRYAEPLTTTYLLFPYKLEDAGGTALISNVEFESAYPNSWAYLKAQEGVLRARENRKMDFDNGWWGYNYPKNLDKQHLPKLIVAQTVPHMQVSFDHDGTYCLNNVRVNGILGPAEQLWMLAGVLNAMVTDFVFRRIAKPKEGGYFEANKQFIAPLPIPKLADPARQSVIELAKHLVTLHSTLREKESLLARRFVGCTMSAVKEPALWPHLPGTETLKAKAPRNLNSRQIVSWAKAELKRRIDEEKGVLLARILGSQRLQAINHGGELKLLGDDVVLLEGIFFDEKATLWDHWWRMQAREWHGGKSVISQLLKVPSTENAALRAQVVALSDELDALNAEIVVAEKQMDDLVANAFGLTAEERYCIAQDPRKGWE